MASESDLEVVRISAELNAGFDGFLAALKRRILDEAVRRASEQKTEDGACTVHREDILTSAQAAFAGAASELEQALTAQGPCYVRKAS